MIISGIYFIKNIINNKYYIGQSSDIDMRWKNHRIELRKNKSRCRYLQNAWNKYGEDNFIFGILETIELTKDNNTNKYLLSLYENDWYCKYYPYIYNIRVISNSNLGLVHSDKTKLKFYGNKNSLGHRHTDSAKNRIRNASSNRLHTEQTKETLSKKKSIRVYQIDIATGIVVKEWSSAKSASQELNIYSSGICNVCRGKQKTAGGYYWRYCEH